MNGISQGGKNTRLQELLMAHPLFDKNEELVDLAAPRVELVQLGFDDVLIGMGREDSDLYVIFSGSLDVLVDGREVARRGAGETAGELEVVAPHVKRTATVVARGNSLVGRISEEDFSELAARYSFLWRKLAHELVRRLIGEVTQ